MQAESVIAVQSTVIIDSMFLSFLLVFLAAVGDVTWSSRCLSICCSFGATKIGSLMTVLDRNFQNSGVRVMCCPVVVSRPIQIASCRPNSFTNSRIAGSPSDYRIVVCNPSSTMSL
eukprot:5058328-Amphidinium_carterae.2